VHQKQQKCAQFLGAPPEEIGGDTAKEQLGHLFETNSWHLVITGDFGVAIKVPQTCFKEAKISAVRPFSTQASSRCGRSHLCETYQSLESLQS